VAGALRTMDFEVLLVTEDVSVIQSRSKPATRLTPPLRTRSMRVRPARGIAINWIRSEADSLALPADVLALEVLANLDGGNGWNVHNWMLDQKNYSGGGEPFATGVL
jgi:hypothetical protein